MPMPFGLTSLRETMSSRPSSPKTSSASETAGSPSKFKLLPPRSILRPPSPYLINSKHQHHQQKSPSKIPTTPKQSPPSPSRPVRSPPFPSSTPTSNSKKSSIPISGPRQTFPLVQSRPSSSATREAQRKQRPPPPQLTRVPSRTQLRHASAARRLSAEALARDILPDNSLSDDKNKFKLRPVSPIRAFARDEDISWSGLRSTVDLNDALRRNEYALKESEERQLKRKEISPKPEEVVHVKVPPYLRKSLEAAGVQVMADSSSMETLLDNKDFLQATFMTPQSVLDKIRHEDSYYHVWVAAKLAREEKPIEEYDLDEVVKLALQKFLVELGSALVDCLRPNLPHYTFIDPRKLMHTEGMNAVSEQAIAVVEGLGRKGVPRDQIYVSIPATETGLAIAKRLKEEHRIKTNLVFVSGFTQAIACAAAGAAAITMPFDKILTYHEEMRGISYAELNPHPGRQNIKATACYMKLHNLETQVIASNLRSTIEIEHCSALDFVCLDDEEVVRTKWARMKVNRPPGPTSHCMTLAKEAPFPPPKFPEEERGFRYFSSMNLDERNEAASVLHAGLKHWQDTVTLIENVLRQEMEKYKPRPPEVPSALPPLHSALLDALQRYESARRSQSQSQSPSSWREPPRSHSIMGGMRVEFPRMVDSDWDDDELDERMSHFERTENSEPPSVPQSPYWTDASAFENEPGSSSDEETTDDMVLF